MISDLLRTGRGDIFHNRRMGLLDDYMQGYRLCTQVRGIVTSEFITTNMEVGIVAWSEGFCGVDVHNVNIPPNRMHI